MNHPDRFYSLFYFFSIKFYFNRLMTGYFFCTDANFCKRNATSKNKESLSIQVSTLRSEIMQELHWLRHILAISDQSKPLDSVTATIGKKDLTPSRFIVASNHHIEPELSSGKTVFHHPVTRNAAAVYSLPFPTRCASYLPSLPLSRTLRSALASERRTCHWGRLFIPCCSIHWQTLRLLETLYFPQGKKGLLFAARPPSLVGWVKVARLFCFGDLPRFVRQTQSRI